MSDEIVVAIGGVQYGGWKAATVTRSIATMCGSFEVEASDRWNQQSVPMEIRPGDSCQILIGGEPVITGYVDKVSPAIGKGEHSVTVSGRDKTSDLVDCSAEVEAFELTNQTLAGIASMLCEKFGIELRVLTDVGVAFNRIPVEPGEKAFDCIERAAKQRGVLCTTDGRGALVLSARSAFESASDSLVEGENIESGTADYDWTNRYSVYTVNGQTPSFDDGADDPCHNQIGVARDVNVMRHRPLLIASETTALPDDVQVRADNECAYRAGESVRVNIQVSGWRQSNGDLWAPGLKILVTAPGLYLDNAELVIATVRYTVSASSGVMTELELTRPDAFLECGEGEVEEDPIEFD